MRLGILSFFAALMIASTPAQACPDWQASPSFGDIQLNAGFLPDPYTRRITAGGGFDIARCFGGGWFGWVARKPDFDLYWNGSSAQLSIMVDSNVDTVLLINSPDGSWWYNDDISANDLRSGITFDWPQAGLYDIWIGTYNRASGVPGTLIITER